MKNLKDISEYRMTTCDTYREDGFNFFNENIMKLALDPSTPILERIKYLYIVITNYMDHYGNSINKFCPWINFSNITKFLNLSGRINNIFSTIDLSELVEFHLNHPELFGTKKSDSDQKILCGDTSLEVKYADKSSLTNYVFDGIKYIPVTHIRDYSITYDISEIGDWSEEYIDEKLNIMNTAYIPIAVLWVNVNISKDKKSILRKYMLDNGYYPIFLNVDILNCMNYKATINNSNLNYDSLCQKNYDFDYFNHKNFCDIIRLPEDSFDNIINLYKQAIHNNKVKSIFITIYRTQTNMQLINTLIEGTHLGKKLNIYIELNSRGDEINNWNLVKKLKAECNSDNLNIYTSYCGYKVHAKIGLIALSDGTYIGHCGTGNFNEVTAKCYKDTHIITDNLDIIKDIIMSFKSIASKNTNNRVKLKKILRKEIQVEIEKGSNGYINLLCNHIADSEIIDLLIMAKQKGCHIELNPRSTFGYSEQDFGVKKFRGGRFLEHERIYIFGQGNNSRIYLSSSDILFRNFYKRMEFTFKLPSYVNQTMFRM